MSNEAKPMGKGKIIRAVIALMLAVAMLALAGCGKAQSARYNKEAAPKEPVFGELSNGDTYYTPDGTHCVYSSDEAVLYYNDLLVVFTDGDLEDADITSIAGSVSGEVVGKVSGGIHCIQLKIADSSLEDIKSMAEKLMENEKVMYACPEYPVQIMGEESDPWGNVKDDTLGDEAHPDGNDWWAEAIGAYTAWEYSDQVGEINVGIVDGGYYVGHEDLEGQITMITDNTVDKETDHGTHVAGIMGALNNDKGIRGIASNAHYYCADVWLLTDNEDSYHTIGQLMAVYNWMAQNDVRVVNNSWGCYSWDEFSYTSMVEGNSLPYNEWLERRLTEELIPTAEATIVMMSQLISSGYDDMIFVQSAGNDSIDARHNGFFSAITEEVYNGMSETALAGFEENGITYTSIDERIYVVGAVYNALDGEERSYVITDFSNYGETVDIYAPGEEIYSTTLSGYESWAGTSMAGPMVTGSIAYVWSLAPELTVSEIREVILGTAENEAIQDADNSCPMLNLGAAVKTVVEE